MEKITIEKSEAVTTEVQIVNQNTDYINKKMRFEVVIYTKTRFVEFEVSKNLEVSNENKFLVFLEKDVPKLNADNEQEVIGEWDMWEILKKTTTLYEGEKIAEESLQRAFGLVQEPFVFILPKEQQQ